MGSLGRPWGRVKGGLAVRCSALLGRALQTSAVLHKAEVFANLATALYAA